MTAGGAPSTTYGSYQKPMRWPEHLDYLLAKSADRGGETLAQHTWEVLEKLAELRDLRPDLTALAPGANLWHCLFWTCLLHDFGKAASGFQAMLGGGGRWNERHEVLSLAFVDWIAGGLGPAEQRGVVAAIASHHKDADDIERRYDDVDPEPLVPLMAELTPTVISDLWRWIDGCAGEWIEALGFSGWGVGTVPLMAHDEAVDVVMAHGAQRMRHWLKRYARWVRDLADDPLPGVTPILLRGLTTTADHMASAHCGRLSAPIQEAWSDLAARVTPGSGAYFHQEESARRSGGSALLMAPTGSGKTEAALYWALGGGSKPVPRLFYALPYQASMNAMFDRLEDGRNGFGKGRVGLQHGRAAQALYARLMDQEARPQTAAQLVSWEKNLNTLHARPVKVLSPYQMLKAAFQLRGFEAMLTDYAQAAFVFDEIHAYEPARLALILALVRYLREHYGARFFVMSATFPQILRAKLLAALELGEGDVVRADQVVFERFRRHRLHLLDGDVLTDGVGRIVDDVRAGRRVLVCVNTVGRAQQMRAALLEAGLGRDEIVTIHSRFIAMHRAEREREVLDRCAIGAGAGSDTNGSGFALVATQVVEVSLNIDLDTLYSDPAPLEALLQRCGRVNRAGSKGICPVHVYRQPDDGQFVYGRHRDQERRGHIVRITLAELEKHDDEIVDEAQVNVWLDAIYADPLLRDEWEAAYGAMATEASALLERLRPFRSDEQTEGQFEDLFDSIDVLPQRFEQEYLDCLTRDEYIEASRYFVGISTRKYRQLCRQGLVRQIEVEDGPKNRWMVCLPYDDQLGLLFDPAAADSDFD